MNETLENLNENTTPDFMAEAVEESDGNTVSVSPPSTPETEDSLEAAPDPSAGELDALRAEIAGLRAQLAAKEQERADALQEIERFQQLFPDVAIRDIPDSVWQQRERGIPLNAAYALYERESCMARARAGEINRQNASRSSGRAGVDAAQEFFSPDEVRAMTPKQIRDNYQKIRFSMKKWN